MIATTDNQVLGIKIKMFHTRLPCPSALMYFFVGRENLVLAFAFWPFLLIFCDMQNAGVLVPYRRSGGITRKEKPVCAFPGWRLAASSLPEVWDGDRGRDTRIPAEPLLAIKPMR